MSKRRKPLPIDTDELCVYGCGNTAKFVTTSGKLICESYATKCEVNRLKNSKGLKRAHATGSMRMRVFSDGDRQKARASSLERMYNQGFVENSTLSNGAAKNVLREYLNTEEKCDECGLSDSWNDKKLELHLDHINGNNTDFREENLRFLCPNCHSQTDTYCGKSMNNGKIKVSDEELIEAIKNNPNVRKTLLSVGLSPKGLNYNRVYKLMANNNLSF